MSNFVIRANWCGLEHKEFGAGAGLFQGTGAQSLQFGKGTTWLHERTSKMYKCKEVGNSLARTWETVCVPCSVFNLPHKLVFMGAREKGTRCSLHRRV